MNADVSSLVVISAPAMLAADALKPVTSVRWPLTSS